tara:strand:- start:102 stop:338 length:237 start_codon:yes stop_codon:yes gene_type:complete
MLKIEALRSELIKVSEEVGKHSLVAKESKISVTYLSQIRNGKNVTLDSLPNKDLITNLILIYRKLGQEQILALTKALK